MAEPGLPAPAVQTRGSCRGISLCRVPGAAAVSPCPATARWDGQVLEDSGITELAGAVQDMGAVARLGGLLPAVPLWHGVVVGVRAGALRTR